MAEKDARAKSVVRSRVPRRSRVRTRPSSRRRRPPRFLGISSQPSPSGARRLVPRARLRPSRSVTSSRLRIARMSGRDGGGGGMDARGSAAEAEEASAAVDGFAGESSARSSRRARPAALVPAALVPAAASPVDPCSCGSRAVRSGTTGAWGRPRMREYTRRARPRRPKRPGTTAAVAIRRRAPARAPPLVRPGVGGFRSGRSILQRPVPSRGATACSCCVHRVRVRVRAAAARAPLARGSEASPVAERTRGAPSRSRQLRLEGLHLRVELQQLRLLLRQHVRGIHVQLELVQGRGASIRAARAGPGPVVGKRARQRRHGGEAHGRSSRRPRARRTRRSTRRRTPGCGVARGTSASVAWLDGARGGADGASKYADAETLGAKPPWEARADSAPESVARRMDDDNERYAEGRLGSEAAPRPLDAGGGLGYGAGGGRSLGDGGSRANPSI